MQLDPFPQQVSAARRFSIGMARHADDVRAAQRLRWNVFVDEQGASIETPEPGYDIDDLDPFCEHLIVKDVARDTVIGTYRLLTTEAARRAGGYYSEREFDISAVLDRDVRLLEIGRSCVMSGYRTGATIALLWSGLAEFLIASGHHALIGCASIPLRPDAAAGAHLAHYLCEAHRSPEGLRVVPRRALPPALGASLAPISLPPLLKGYLRSGAVICGAPCWDPEFDCADVFVHLGIEQLSSRYARRFLPEVGSSRSAPHRTPAIPACN